MSATGDLPPFRSEFCAGVSSAPDDSSFQITVYGGWDLSQSRILNDVYVLSIPSFQWIKVEAANDPDGGNGRAHQQCNMWNEGQLILSGGSTTQVYNPYCDTSHPPIKVLDTSEYVWRTQFQPGLTYTVPGLVSAVIGGK